MILNLRRDSFRRGGEDGSILLVCGTAWTLSTHLLHFDTKVATKRITMLMTHFAKEITRAAHIVQYYCRGAMNV